MVGLVLSAYASSRLHHRKPLRREGVSVLLGRFLMGQVRWLNAVAEGG